MKHIKIDEVISMMQKCGKIEDIGFDLISDLGICTLPDHQTIETFEVTLRGLCTDCVKK